MKKIVAFILAVIFSTTAVFAQLREVPASVTDAFKSRYPHADNVAWKDKLGYFEATFQLSGAEVTADFSSKGEWKSSEAKTNYEDLPSSVRDGFSKSKYNDWTKGSVTEIQHMDKPVQYRIYVEKSQPFQKKFLYFNGSGALIKDALTL